MKNIQPVTFANYNYNVNNVSRKNEISYKANPLKKDKWSSIAKKGILTSILVGITDYFNTKTEERKLKKAQNKTKKSIEEAEVIITNTANIAVNKVISKKGAQKLTEEDEDYKHIQAIRETSREIKEKLSEAVSKFEPGATVSLTDKEVKVLDPITNCYASSEREPLIVNLRKQCQERTGFFPSNDEEITLECWLRGLSDKTAINPDCYWLEIERKNKLNQLVSVVKTKVNTPGYKEKKEAAIIDFTKRCGIDPENYLRELDKNIDDAIYLLECEEYNRKFLEEKI